MGVTVRVKVRVKVQSRIISERCKAGLSVRICPSPLTLVRVYTRCAPVESCDLPSVLSACASGKARAKFTSKGQG